MANLKSAILDLSVVSFALILAACNGSSMVNRTSNPTKPYQNAIDNSQPWKRGMARPGPVKDADNRQFYCGNDVFRLKVNGNPSLRRAEFHADVEGVIDLKIETKETTAFKLEKVGGPKGLSLRSLGDPTHWQLSWKPSREDVKQDTVKLVIIDEELRAKCQFSYAEPLDLVVDPGPDAPVLTITELSATPLEFSPIPVRFTVLITDPAGTPDKVPAISEVGADERQISNPESRQHNVSAKGAVTCDEVQPRGPNTWAFPCFFVMSKLPGVDSLSKTSQVINAVFFIKGKSIASGLDAPQASGAIQVRFTVAEPVKTEAPAPIPQQTARARMSVPANLASARGEAVRAKPKKKERKSQVAKPKSVAKTEAPVAPVAPKADASPAPKAAAKTQTKAQTKAPAKAIAQAAKSDVKTDVKADAKGTAPTAPANAAAPKTPKTKTKTELQTPTKVEGDSKINSKSQPAKASGDNV